MQPAFAYSFECRKGRKPLTLFCFYFRSLHQPITCGFDIEWRVTYKAGEGPRKTAVFQLCMSEKECFIFHISAMTGSIYEVNLPFMKLFNKLR